MNTSALRAATLLTVLASSALALEPTTAPLTLWGVIREQSPPAALAICVSDASGGNPTTAVATVCTSQPVATYLAEFERARVPPPPLRFTFLFPEASATSTEVATWPGRLDCSSGSSPTTCPCRFLMASATQGAGGSTLEYRAVIACDGLGNNPVQGTLRSGPAEPATTQGLTLRQGLNMAALERPLTGAAELPPIDRLFWQPDSSGGPVPPFAQALQLRGDGQDFAIALDATSAPRHTVASATVTLLDGTHQVQCSKFEYLSLEMECDLATEADVRQALSGCVLTAAQGPSEALTLPLDTLSVQPLPGGAGSWLSSCWLLRGPLLWNGVALSSRGPPAAPRLTGHWTLRYLGRFVPQEAGGDF